jgi:hypothetical protein
VLCNESGRVLYLFFREGKEVQRHFGCNALVVLFQYYTSLVYIGLFCQCCDWTGTTFPNKNSFVEGGRNQYILVHLIRDSCHSYPLNNDPLTSRQDSFHSHLDSLLPPTGIPGAHAYRCMFKNLSLSYRERRSSDSLVFWCRLTAETTTSIISLNVNY